MAGLYIHIPFCRDACSYCDFHFSVSLAQMGPVLKAIGKELASERDFLQGEELETIYLGGGTPSVLKPVQLESIFRTIRTNYRVQPDAEITLEANPDDLDTAYLAILRETGINRLSIGIQSFHEEDLELMNRRHDSTQAHSCLESAAAAGFENLSLDLIYGFPGLTDSKWRKNLKTVLEYRPVHLAAYHLSYEPGSVLEYRRKKGRIVPLDEETSFGHYTTLVEEMNKHGYRHYEISNFALPGFISRHNSGYWMGKKYLGVGPSAHSYNGRIRRWNMAKNASYVRGILKGEKVYEEEQLEEKSGFHDYLMTSLRTCWGADTAYIRDEWGKEYQEHILKQSLAFIRSGKMIRKKYKLILTTEGMFLADHILRKLFL